MNTRCIGLDRVVGVLLIVLAQLLTGVAAAAGSPKGEFEVWAIGLPNGYVVMEHQTPVVQVTAEDVARGVVDVQGGTRIVINTTGSSGIVVDYQHLTRFFRSVRINGVGRSFELGPAGGTMVESEASPGRRVLTINYRFTLAPDIVPGRYAWPLSMTARHPLPRDLGIPSSTISSSEAKGKT